MFSKILVPLDGSTTAEKVLPCARYLAARLKAPVELLAVVDLGEIAAHMRSEKARFFDTMLEEGVRHLSEYLRGIATTFASGNVECSVKKGKPEEVVSLMLYLAGENASFITGQCYMVNGGSNFL